MEIKLGERLRAVRLASGYSQRELARRSGVPNSTISLVESDRINPSVGALKRILDGIPIGLSEFFALPTAQSGKYFYASEELAEIGKGGISYRQIGGDLTGRSLQIMAETYQVGTDTGRIMLSHDGEEGGIVIRGNLEVFVGDDRMVLGAGDAYYFDSTLPHRFRNNGKRPCEVVSACTPPTF